MNKEQSARLTTSVKAESEKKVSNAWVCCWLLFILAGIPMGVHAQEANAVNVEVQSHIDDAMNEFMVRIRATAATVAVFKDGKPLYSKGYGFSDRRGKVLTTPRTTMRLASCTKPFTSAAIEILIKNGELNRDTKIFDLLDIKPHKTLGDPRIKEITIAQLLDHRGGWDRDIAFDPMYDLKRLKKELRVNRMRKQHVVRYMWSQPIQHAPGSQHAYSNFGYLLLGLAIEKTTGESYVNSIRQLIGESIDAEIAISSPVKSNRQSREVHYPVDNNLDFRIRDAASGLTTNAETLCRFMGKYWLDGQAMDERKRYLFQYGTHPYTTSVVMEQRLDRIHFALMFNSRRNEDYNVDNEDIRIRFNRLLDEIVPQLDDQ